MFVKSTCSNSKGAVAMMGCIDALAQVPSCWMHHSQQLMAFCICMAIPGHQNQSCSRYRVCCWPWCPASWWHPFMAATWWAMETTKLQNSFHFTSWCVAMVEGSLVECQLFLLMKDSFPSSMFALSPSRCFRSCTSWLEIYSIMVLSIGSSCWAITQSVTCRFTCSLVALARTTVSQTWLCISSSASATTGLLFPWWLHPGWTSWFLCPASIWLSSEDLWLHCAIPFGIQCWRWTSQVTYPMVSGSIWIRCSHNVGEQIVVSSGNVWFPE